NNVNTMSNPDNVNNIGNTSNIDNIIDMEDNAQQMINRLQLIKQKSNLKILSLTLHNDEIYVIYNTNIVQVYNLKGDFLREWKNNFNNFNNQHDEEYIACKTIIHKDPKTPSFHKDHMYIMMTTKNSSDITNFNIYMLE